MRLRNLSIIHLLLMLSTLSGFSATRVLVNGVHGNPELYPMQGGQSLNELTQRFPEVEFHLIEAAELPVCRVLLEGTLAQGNHSFNVPEEASSLLSTLYLIDRTVDDFMQLPWHYLTDPAASQYYQFENSIIVENPLPGQWEVWIDCMGSPVGREITIALGPPLFDTIPLPDFDLQLMLPNYVNNLFRGIPHQFSGQETDRLDDYLTAGGYLVISRQSGIFAEKPVVQLYDISRPMSWEVIFPGVLSFGEPLIDCRRSGANSLFSRLLQPAVQTTILYEGVVNQPLRPLEIVEQGSAFRITNRGADQLGPCFFFRLQSDDRVQLLTYSTITPGATAAIPVTDELLSRSEWRSRMDQLMQAAEIAGGMTSEEAGNFSTNWHWTGRFDQTISEEWQGLYLFHTDTYDQLIPLQGVAQEETVRLLWYYDSPVRTACSSHTPFSTGIEPVRLPCSVYHEYGVVWDQDFPEQLDQQYFAINFTDVALEDETDNCNYSIEIAFHTFDTGSPIAAQLLEGVEQLCGELATGITGEGVEFPITGDNDTWGYEEPFQPGSYPPVAAIDYHGEGAVFGMSDQGFLQDRADNHQFLLNLFEALDQPGPGDESWLMVDPPVQELFFCTTGRTDLEFNVINMGRDSTTVTAGVPSVSWLEPADVSPDIIAPGGTALVEYIVLWDDPELVDGEYDIELPVYPGAARALIHAIVSLQQVTPLPQQLLLVQAVPNPFNSTTCLELELTTAQPVDLSLFNQLGHRLTTLSGQHQLQAGLNRIELDFTGNASGVYYYRLRLADGADHCGAVTLIQ